MASLLLEKNEPAHKIMKKDGQHITSSTEPREFELQHYAVQIYNSYRAEAQVHNIADRVRREDIARARIRRQSVSDRFIALFPWLREKPCL